MKSIRRVPAYLYLMTAITAVYLTVEVPFSARLLDVMGSSPTMDDIGDIEKFGRVLTGCAVAIAVMGWYFARAHRPWDIQFARTDTERLEVIQRMYYSRRPRFGRTVGKAFAIGAACVGATYLALDRIAEAIGDYSTGDARKGAFQSILAKNSIAAGRVSDESLRTLDASSLPAWKAFVSVAPALDRNGGLLALAGVDAETLRRDEAIRRLGTPEELRVRLNEAVIPQLENAYDQYRTGQRKYADAARRAEAEIVKRWNEYATWYRRNVRGNPMRYVTRIRQELRGRGVPVRDDWHPTDRKGFEEALRGRLYRTINFEFDQTIERHLGWGAKVSPHLRSFNEFVRQEAVQRKIRSMAGLPPGIGIIRPSMTPDEFRKEIYLPAIDGVISELTNMFMAPPGDFATGGRYQEEGRKAAQMASIPALAILLSLAGALLHICKVSGFLTQLVGYATGIRLLCGTAAKWGAGMAVAASMATGMILFGNSVTSSVAYSRLTSMGNAATPLITGAIAMQPLFQPLGYAIGKVGAWQLFADMVPLPRHTETTIVFVDRPTSTEVATQ